MNFQDFVDMTPAERIEHIKKHGLTILERKELLKMNEIIATLMREDAGYNAKHGRVIITRRYGKKW